MITPQINQKIKCILKNSSATIEGIVQEWNERQAVLMSATQKTLLIVPLPYDNIVLIMLPIENKRINLPEMTENNLSQDIKNKKLAELHALKIQTEKEIVAEKLKSHTSSGVAQVKYTFPNNLPRK